MNVSNVEGTFESFALSTISGIPLFPIQPNSTPYASRAREAATNGDFRNVVPDGVLPLIVIRSPFDIRQYDNSVFYEAKAVSNSSLSPSEGSGPYQILGLIDAARRSTPAGQVPDDEEVPAVVFLTTSDVVPLSVDTRLIAYAAGVGLLHSIVCEPILSFTPGALQLGPAELLDPEVYSDTGVTPGPVGPGAPDQLQNYSVP